MSYMIYVAECDRCFKKINTSFGMVGTTLIAEPVVDCECGGKFKKIETPVVFEKVESLEEMGMALLHKDCQKEIDGLKHDLQHAKEIRSHFTIGSIQQCKALTEACEGILSYFKSGNGIEVERAVIRHDSVEIKKLKEALAQ